MVNDFQMTISTEDFLRIVNVGIKDLVTSIGNLVDPKDKVVAIQYSRDTKRYTLVFASGAKLKVIEAQKAANAKFVGDLVASV
jgi:hypothetical protein